MKEIRKEPKRIEPIEFEKYQEYLRERHKEGWKLVKNDFYHHYFEACEPEDYLYEIDASKDMTLKEKEAYIGMYQEFGYEFVTQTGRIYYFRKKAKEGEEAFGGRESAEEKFEKVKRMKEFHYDNLRLLFILFLLNKMNAVIYIFMSGLWNKWLGFGVFLPAALLMTPIAWSYLKFRKVYKQYKKK